MISLLVNGGQKLIWSPYNSSFMKNNSKASIREVYIIATRLEEKIDKIDSRVSSIEAKASILAVVWSSFISIAGILVGVWIKR